MYAPDSIELLKRAGIDFMRAEHDGIDVHVFGDMLTTSGVVLNDQITVC